jgi:hypothetical protein
MGLRISGRPCFMASPVAPLLAPASGTVIAEPPGAAQPSTDLFTP